MLIRMFSSAFMVNNNNILSLLEKENNARLLDLGCNDGVWTQEVGRNINTINICGVDNAKEQTWKAKRNGIKTKRSNLNSVFPYRSGVFDVIHSNQVIEHLIETRSFVDEIYRVLKPGGYAVISTENLASWHNMLSLIFGWQPFSLAVISGYKIGVGNPMSIHKSDNIFSPWEHVRVFSYKAFLEIFTERGFLIEEVLGAGYYPLPNCFAKLDPKHAAFLTIKIRKK